MSETTFALLQMANIKPKRIDNYFDRQAAKRRLMLLTPKSYYMKKIRKDTGVPVSLLYRQNLTILIEVEWGTKEISWIHKYKEESQKNCLLYMGSGLPQSAATLARGRKLSEMVEGFELLDNREIVAIDTSDHSTIFHLRQSWIPIE